MAKSEIVSDQVNLNDFLKDPLIIKLVTIVNRASLSILELFEYDFTRHDISSGFATGVIEFDKSTQVAAESEVPTMLRETGGDYYFRFLGHKIRLTE